MEPQSSAEFAGTKRLDSTTGYTHARDARWVWTWESRGSCLLDAEIDAGVWGRLSAYLPRNGAKRRLKVGCLCQCPTHVVGTVGSRGEPEWGHRPSTTHKRTQYSGDARAPRKKKRSRSPEKKLGIQVRSLWWKWTRGLCWPRADTHAHTYVYHTYFGQFSHTTLYIDAFFIILWRNRYDHIQMDAYLSYLS